MDRTSRSRSVRGILQDGFTGQLTNTVESS